jgi:hypothetical protein
VAAGELARALAALDQLNDALESAGAPLVNLPIGASADVRALAARLEQLARK